MPNLARIQAMLHYPVSSQPAPLATPLTQIEKIVGTIGFAILSLVTLGGYAIYQWNNRVQKTAENSATMDKTNKIVQNQPPLSQSPRRDISDTSAKTSSPLSATPQAAPAPKMLTKEEILQRLPATSRYRSQVEALSSQDFAKLQSLSSELLQGLEKIMQPSAASFSTANFSFERLKPHVASFTFLGRDQVDHVQVNGREQIGLGVWALLEVLKGQVFKTFNDSILGVSSLRIDPGFFIFMEGLQKDKFTPEFHVFGQDQQSRVTMTDANGQTKELTMNGFEEPRSLY